MCDRVFSGRTPRHPLRSRPETNIKVTIMLRKSASALASVLMLALASPAFAVECPNDNTSAFQKRAYVVTPKEHQGRPQMHSEMRIDEEKCADSTTYVIKDLPLSLPLQSGGDVKRAIDAARTLNGLKFTADDVAKLYKYVQDKERAAAGTPQATVKQN